MKAIHTILTYFFISIFSISLAQPSDQSPEIKRDNYGKIRLFLDCNYCDNGFFMQNIANVTFVRDRKLADVHLLFTSQPSGSGGSSERIQFIGLGAFKHLSDILSYSTDVNMTQDEKRTLRMKYIELGLVRYRVEAGQFDAISLEIAEAETEKAEEEDPWNYWIFSMNAGGRFNGQETSNSRNFNGSVAARRITENNKFIARGGFTQNINIFNYDGVETIARRRNTWSNIRDIISINDHWSYGFFGNVGNSIFGNYRFYGEATAGIEYDFFKYSESFNKQAIIAYNIGGRYNNYYDTTVFNVDEDRLAFHEVTIGGAVKQDWGNLSSTISYQNYLHDFSLNSVSFWLNFRVRLFKGFSWRINGSFDILHNQVNIAKQGASIEDVLLQQQQLGSGYSYWMNTGINYSFGSIYNSAVNPRFDI